MGDGAGRPGWEPVEAGSVCVGHLDPSASAQPKSLPAGSLPSIGQMDNKKAVERDKMIWGHDHGHRNKSEQGLNGVGMATLLWTLEN